MISKDLKLAIYKQIMYSIDQPLSEHNINKLLDFVDSSIAVLQCNLPGAEGLNSSRFHAYLPNPSSYTYLPEQPKKLKKSNPSLTVSSQDETAMAKELRSDLTSIMANPFGLKTLMKMKRMLSAISRLAHTSDKLYDATGNYRVADTSKFTLDDSDSIGDSNEDYDDKPYSTSSPQENYGAKMLREILAMVPMLIKAQQESNVSPVDLVQAIALAESNGQDDLAAQLKMKLGLESVTSVKATISESSTIKPDHTPILGSA